MPPPHLLFSSPSRRLELGSATLSFEILPLKASSNAIWESLRDAHHIQAILDAMELNQQPS